MEIYIIWDWWKEKGKYYTIVYKNNILFFSEIKELSEDVKHER